MANKSLIVIVGPTAVGKTKLTTELAKLLSCAVINADSRQLFKEITIGTAKPTAKEMGNVRHYFVDDRSIEQEFNAGKFEVEAMAVLNKEYDQNDICILSGGSGLYIDALCLGLNNFPEVEKHIRIRLEEELEERGTKALYDDLQKVDPEYAAIIEPNNSQRIIRGLEIFESSGKKYSSMRLGMGAKRDFKVHYIGLDLPRDVLYDRINARMDRMINDGLFDEAESLLRFRNKNALQTVGYNEVFMYLDGIIDRTEAIRILKRNSRRYAKRQLTWFKRNKEIAWFHPDQLPEIHQYLLGRLHT